jgi:hypothetical protein
MAKPDLQNVTVTPAGELRRDPGQNPQALTFSNLLNATNDGDATTSGVPLRGVYINRSTGAVTVRQS